MRREKKIGRNLHFRIKAAREKRKRKEKKEERKDVKSKGMGEKLLAIRNVEIREQKWKICREVLLCNSNLLNHTTTIKKIISLCMLETQETTERKKNPGEFGPKNRNNKIPEFSNFVSLRFFVA